MQVSYFYVIRLGDRGFTNLLHCYKCKRRCMDELTDVEPRAIMSKLYDGRPKNEQDTYLQG